MTMHWKTCRISMYVICMSDAMQSGGFEICVDRVHVQIRSPYGNSTDCCTDYNTKWGKCMQMLRVHIKRELSLHELHVLVLVTRSSTSIQSRTG